MESNLNSYLNLFVNKLNLNLKFENREEIELETEIDQFDDRDLYVKRCDKKLHEIIKDNFKKDDEIIYCANLYKYIVETKYYTYPLKMRRYLKVKANINMVSNVIENEFYDSLTNKELDLTIEHYYTHIKFNELKINKLISEIVRKDLGQPMEGLETVFLINKRTLKAVALYDDRYADIEY